MAKKKAHLMNKISTHQDPKCLTNYKQYKHKENDSNTQYWQNCWKPMMHQRSNCQRLLDHRKSKRIPENIYFCFNDHTKAFDCVDHHKLWKILKEMEIPDHLTYLLRNLYAAQEATVRSGHRRRDWFQIGKRILSLCLFNLYAEYIMWNARLDEAQAVMKIAGGNINNLRYADDITLWQKEKN